MENIWSKNKYVNITINVLLFLLGINFMHYAQILVPIICLIIFIDNKFKFHVNNLKTFIILCLFGISFLIFAFDQGAFAFIGLFLPMAYYVGSNVYEATEEKIKNIVYIFAFGMTMHIVLNFATDLIFRGLECFSKNSHLDIWTFDKIPTTQTAANYVLLIAIIFYVFVFEKNKKYKIISFILSLVSLIYLFALGRRTPFLLLVVVLLVNVLFYIFTNSKPKILSIVIVAVILLLLFISVLWAYYAHKENIFYAKPELLNLSILRKIYSDGLGTERLQLFIDTIKLAPKHLFGGYEISDILGYGPHELWLDIFDIAGIVPYVFIVIYSIVCLINIIRVIINDKYTNTFKQFVLSVTISFILQFFIEPIMSGSSVILLCAIIIFASLECLNRE